MPGLSLELAVAKIQRMFDRDAKVTQNEFIVDRLGNKRQCDVVVRSTFAGMPILGIVECKDHRVRMGPDVVEGFARKCEHLNANLKVIVSTLGFTESAMNLARHEGVGCLSLLPSDDHKCSLTIGEWWYGVVSKWKDLRFSIDFVDVSLRSEDFKTEDVYWNGAPVVNFFWRALVTQFRDATQYGLLKIDAPFTRVVNLTINEREFEARGVTCFVQGIYAIKKKWVTYSGDGYFDWQAEKVRIPPGGQVVTNPVETDLESWDDHNDVIPAMTELRALKLMRGVFLFTNVFDEGMPVPDLALISPDVLRNDLPKPKIDCNGFDANSSEIQAVLSAASKSLFDNTAT